MYAVVERSWPDEGEIAQAAVHLLMVGVWDKHGPDAQQWVPVLIDQAIAEKKYALAIQQECYTCPWIPSELNYQAFMCWLSAQPLGVALHLGNTLPLINHKEKPGD